MSELKVDHRKKGSIDMKAIINQQGRGDLAHNEKRRKAGAAAKGDSKAHLLSTTPSLVKIAKTSEDYFESEASIKPNTKKAKEKEKEINDLIGKYEKGTIGDTIEINFQRDPEKNELQHDKKLCEDMEEVIDMNNVLNGTAIKEKEKENKNNQEKADPVTERECSFIQHISINHENFMGEGNEKENENEVVLCISSLEIDNSMNRKNNGLLHLNTDENLFSMSKNEKKTISISSPELNLNLNEETSEAKKNETEKDHVNLINANITKNASRWRKYKKVIIFSLVFLFLLLGVVGYLIYTSLD